MDTLKELPNLFFIPLGEIGLQRCLLDINLDVDFSFLPPLS